MKNTALAYRSSSEMHYSCADMVQSIWLCIHSHLFFLLQGWPLLKWRLPKWLVNYSWASTAGKACCKLLQDTSWDLATPEEAELGSDTLEQSLLPWLNAVMHETTQLLQCLDEWFLVYFPASSFSCCALLVTIYPELYEPMCRARV